MNSLLDGLFDSEKFLKSETTSK